MKHARTLLALSALAVLVSGLPAQAQKKPAQKYPFTFVCKHCKIKMTVKKASDLKKNCWVCPCKKTTQACQPKT